MSIQKVFRNFTDVFFSFLTHTTTKPMHTLLPSASIFSKDSFFSFWQIFDRLDLFILVLMVARGYNVSDMIAPAKIDDCYSNFVLSPHETTDSSKKNKSNPKVCSFPRETQRIFMR